MAAIWDNYFPNGEGFFSEKGCLVFTLWSVVEGGGGGSGWVSGEEVEGGRDDRARLGCNGGKLPCTFFLRDLQWYIEMRHTHIETLCQLTQFLECVLPLW